MKHLAISLFFILFFTGCLTKELPSYTTYALKLDKSESSLNNPVTNKSIYVAQPRALSSLKSRNIQYSKQLEKNSYALSIWSDEPSLMIQQLLTARLASSKSYGYVSSSKLQQSADYTLYSELLNFEHTIEDKASYALLTIRVYLKNNHSSKIDVKEFSYKEVVENLNANSAVWTLNKISNRFFEEANSFISDKISQ